MCAYHQQKLPLGIRCPPNLQMSNDEFGLSFGVRMGLSIIGSRKYCLCGDELSPNGEHAMLCQTIYSNRFKDTIHIGMKKVLTNFLKQGEGELGAKVMEGEPKYQDYLVPVKEDEIERRADVGLQYDTDERCDLIDVTSTSSSAGHNSSDRMFKQYKPGHSAELAEQRKVKEVEERFRMDSNPQVTFIPFGMETTGALGPSAVAYSSKVAKALAAKADGNDSGRSYAYKLRQIKQNLSVSLQGIRAKSIMYFLKNLSLDNKPNMPLPRHTLLKNFPQNLEPPAYIGLPYNTNRRFAVNSISRLPPD
jgi:hypothetical protein